MDNGFLELLELAKDYGSIFSDIVSSSDDFTNDHVENSGAALNFSSALRTVSLEIAIA